MDAVNDDRGQALILAVLIIAIASVAVSGLRIAQEQILASAQERRAGEAAVEAATAVIADAYTAELGRVAPARSPDVLGAITDPRARDTARAAATEVSLLNGGPEIGDVTVRCAKGLVDVSIAIAARLYRAGFSGPSCFPR